MLTTLFAFPFGLSCAILRLLKLLLLCDQLLLLLLNHLLLLHELLLLFLKLLYLGSVRVLLLFSFTIVFICLFPVRSFDLIPVLIIIFIFIIIIVCAFLLLLLCDSWLSSLDGSLFAGCWHNWWGSCGLSLHVFGFINWLLLLFLWTHCRLGPVGDRPSQLLFVG